MENMPEVSSAETTAETTRGREGLIFDRAKEIRRAVGPEISKEEAKALEGAHLQDELMIEQRMRSIYSEPEDEDTIQEVIQTVRNYRETHGLALSHSADEIRKLLPEDAGFNEQFINELAGVDLANRDRVLEIAERNLGGADAVRGAHHVEMLVTNSVLADREERSEAGETHNWNKSLKEFFPNVVKDIQILAHDARISPEMREKAQEFVQNLGPKLEKAGKELKDALTPKDWREASTLLVQLATDFAPEVGEAFMVINLSAMGAKELETVKRIAQEKDAKGLALASQWFKQTTMGEILFKNPDSKLKDWQRYAAGAVGTGTSIAALMLSRAIRRGVRAPGASALVAATVSRGVQYALPKVLDWATEKAFTKAGAFETEEERQEFVEKTLQTSRVATTILASASMGIGFFGSHQPVPGAPRGEGPFGDLNRIIGETGEIVGDSAEQAADTILELKDEAVEGVKEFAEQGVQIAEEQLGNARDIIQEEVNDTVEEVQEAVDEAKTAWEKSETRQGLQDLQEGLGEAREQYMDFFERLDDAIKDLKKDLETNETVTESDKEVMVPDGFIKGNGYDTNSNGKDDSWWLVPEDGGKIEAALLPDGDVLHLGPEGGAKGVIAEYILDDMLKANPDPSSADYGEGPFQSNPLANPDLINNIATKVTESLDLNSAGEATELINSPDMGIEVIKIYKDLAIDNAIDWVKDRVPIDEIGDFFKKLQLNVDPSKIDPGSIPEGLRNMEGVTITDEGRTFEWKDITDSQWFKLLEKYANGQ